MDTELNVCLTLKDDESGLEPAKTAPLPKRVASKPPLAKKPTAKKLTTDVNRAVIILDDDSDAIIILDDDSDDDMSDDALVSNCKSTQIIARAKYLELCGNKKIEVFQITTYQGRLITSSTGVDSVNGCAVISPLVVVYHLNSEGAGIANNMIVQIIDEIAPVILSRVRMQLGLPDGDLINPSDAHECLVDGNPVGGNILNPSMFVGVRGGNLCDAGNVTDFLKLFGHDDDQQPIAAALLFHAHVVSILKVVQSDGSIWYDLVDSMPTHFKTVIGASRTRCKDIVSLRALLYWYACEKFSVADAKYIDSKKWDARNCERDPRVFQGFAWKKSS